MNELKCRICSGDIVYHDNRGGIECGQCGSLMIKDVPSQETLSGLYADYNARYSGGGSSHGKNQIHYAMRYLRAVNKYSHGGSLVDIGCANNPFPNVAARAGLKATAIDYSCPEKLDPKVEFINGNLNSPQLLQLDRKFDIVTCWAVIEHVADPEMAFAIFAKLLDKNGQLHVVVPEHGTGLTKHSAGRTLWFYPPDHLHLISPVGMEVLARRHGLKLMEWRHFEINRLRWLLRFGIGLAETLAGRVLRLLNPKLWAKIRDSRFSRFSGAVYCRFNHIS